MTGSVLLQVFRDVSGENEAWQQQLRNLLPNHKILTWETTKAAEKNNGLARELSEVEYAVIWTMPLSDIAKLPRIRAVLLLGAGADQLQPIDALPVHIPIVRLIDEEVARDMASYALHWVLHFHYSLDEYIRRQAKRVWLQCPPYPPRGEFTVGVLGLGNVGSAVCETMKSVGYCVLACGRTGRHFDGVQTFPVEELDSFLSECNALINVLPMTAATANILDAARLQQLPRGALIINMGRGGTLVDSALCDALDSGHLKAAILDTFRDEPLPSDSPFWKHEKIVVTPHISGRTYARSAAKYVADNIARIERGENPFPVLDRQRGY